MVHPNDGLHPQRNFPILLLQSRKMKGYTLQKNYYTSSSRSHNLSSNTIQYHTILNHFTMLSFIGKIQWKNSRVNPIPWVYNTVGQHTSQKKNSRGIRPQTPRQGEWLYSTPGLQTQLNNFYISRRLGSTTNKKNSKTHPMSASKTPLIMMS